MIEPKTSRPNWLRGLNEQFVVCNSYYNRRASYSMHPGTQANVPPQRPVRCCDRLRDDAGAEKIYDLENDNNGEGFNVWSVFYAKTIYDAKIWAKIWIDGVPQFIERIGILDVDNVNFLARLTIDADY